MQILTTFAPAEAVLRRYGEELTARNPWLADYPVTLTLEAPKADAPAFSGDERFALRVGCDGAQLTAHSPRGAMFAAYAFLEEAFGIRWIAEDCDDIPEVPVLRCFERDCEPDFAYRELYWRGALAGDYALKLRLNSARAAIPPEAGGGVGFYNYSHTFAELIDPETEFDAHPEYFSYFDGARQKERSQLCLTNPEVLERCTAGVRAWMRAHPDKTIFSVAMNDWYGYCRCEACRAVDEAEGSPAGTMIRFVNRIAEAIAAEFPRNYIHTFAYLYCRRPPRLTRPRKNVIVRLCAIECCYAHPMRTCGSAVAAIDVAEGSARRFTEGERLFREDLAEWSAAAPNLFVWDYTTNYANYLQPFPNLGVLQDNLRLMWEAGVSGVFEQGNYAPGTASAFAGLKVYVLGHLLWDTEADVRALTDEYLDGRFGPAADALRRYLAVMQPTDHLGIFDAPDATAIPDAAVAEGCALMAEALAACRTEAQRRAVRMEALSPEYLRLARLPLDAPGRLDAIDAFEAEARALGITELFERRDLDASFACLRRSRFCRDRSAVPYRVYRL